MSGPIDAPPGLMLAEDTKAGDKCTLRAPPGLSLPQEDEDDMQHVRSTTSVRPPPGFAPLEARLVAPPPGLCLAAQSSDEDEVVPTKPAKRGIKFSIADHIDIADEVPVCAAVPVCPALPAAGAKGYGELQKTLFEKKQIEKKMKRLEVLVTCFEDLGALQRSADQHTTERVALGAQIAAKKMAASAAAAAAKVEKPSLWSKKESKSHKGKFYYVHSETGKTSWTKPEDYVEPSATPVVVPVPPVVVQSAAPLSPCKPCMGLSENDESTDACSSDSDYDSDFAQSVFSMGSARHMVVRKSTRFRAEAAEFKPSAKTTFRADAPAFQPGSAVVMN